MQPDHALCGFIRVCPQDSNPPAEGAEDARVARGRHGVAER